MSGRARTCAPLPTNREEEQPAWELNVARFVGLTLLLIAFLIFISTAMQFGTTPNSRTFVALSWSPQYACRRA